LIVGGEKSLNRCYEIAICGGLEKKRLVAFPEETHKEAGLDASEHVFIALEI
jgi:hypothetical protein